MSKDDCKTVPRDSLMGGDDVRQVNCGSRLRIVGRHAGQGKGQKTLGFRMTESREKDRMEMVDEAVLFEPELQTCLA